MKAYGKDLEKIPAVPEAYGIISRLDILRVLSAFIMCEELSCTDRLKSIDSYIRLTADEPTGCADRDVTVKVCYGDEYVDGDDER